MTLIIIQLIDQNYFLFQVVPKKEGAAQKAKSSGGVQEPILNDVLNCPVLVSSHVAVNTEATFSNDTYTDIYNDDLNASHHEENLVRSKPATALYVQYDPISPEEDHIEESIIPKESLNITSDLHIAEEKSPEKCNIPVSMDFQTDFYTADIELANSKTNSPKSSLSPIKAASAFSNSQFPFDEHSHGENAEAISEVLPEAMFEPKSSIEKEFVENSEKSHFKLNLESQTVSNEEFHEKDNILSPFPDSTN